MTVLGVDPGLRLGWALLDLDRPEARALMAHGRVTTRPADGDEATRRAKVLAEVKPYICSAELVAIEAQFVATDADRRVAHRKSANAAQVRAVACAIEDYAVAQGKRVVWVDAAKAKKALAGRGDASKEQMVAMAAARFGEVLSEHEADACGIALAGAALQERARVPKPTRRKSRASRDPLKDLPPKVQEAARRANKP